MADPLDLRDWQRGLDPGLVRRLQRPLRRSAGVGCAWAGEALARGQLGKLPLLAGWMARWGMNEATIGELRPVVHALGSERASHDAGQGATSPRVTASARHVMEPRSPMVAVARQVAAPDEARPREGSSGGLTETRVVREVLVTPTREDSGGAAGAERGSPNVDLRIDPALLVAPQAATPRAAAPIVVTRPGNERDLPPRPRTRPQLMTPMDLARAQAEQHGPGPVAARIAGVAAAAPVVAMATPTATATPTPIVTPTATPMPTPAPIIGAVGGSLPLVHPSSQLPSAAAVTRASTVAGPPTAPAMEPLRVRPRVVAASVEPVLRDSNERGARPRVSVAAPMLPSTAALTGLAAPVAHAPQIDVALPGAGVRQAVAAPTLATTTLATTAASAPSPGPLAQVATSQLDIPAIAQAVHRHLERELRWERERRGGRP